MKKTISILCIILVLGAMLAGCASSAPTAKVTGLAGDTETYTLGVNESVPIGLSMTADVVSSDGTTNAYTLAYSENGFTWPDGMDETITAALSSWAEVNPTFKSADESVAAVNDMGIVSGTRAGNTTITASVVDPSGETVNVTIPITVVQYVERLDVNIDTLELLYIEDATDETQTEDAKESENEEATAETPANTATIIAAVWPNNSNDSTITFSSSDDAVVSVDDEGKITATGVGEAELLVSAPGGKEELTHIIKVAVSVPTPAIFEVPEGKEEQTFTVGKGFAFPLDLGEDNVENYNIVYSSSNESVAVVTDTGWVDCAGVGEAEISAKIPQSDMIVVIIVTVQPAPASTGGNRGGGNSGTGGNGGSSGVGAANPGNDGGAAEPGNGGGEPAPAPAPTPTPTVDPYAAAAAAFTVGGFANYSSSPTGQNYAGISASSFGGDQNAANAWAISVAMNYASLSEANQGVLNAWSDGTNIFVGLSHPSNDEHNGLPGGGYY